MPEITQVFLFQYKEEIRLYLVAIALSMSEHIMILKRLDGPLNYDIDSVTRLESQNKSYLNMTELYFSLM